MIKIEKKTPRFSLRMEIIHMGQDLNVSLYGGDKPHIGATALAVPHPGLREKGICDASVSVLSVTGHKEDELARKTAFTFATRFNCTVSVTCGIHLENATKQEIQDVLEASEELLQQAVNKL